MQNRLERTVSLAEDLRQGKGAVRHISYVYSLFPTELLKSARLQRRAAVTSFGNQGEKNSTSSGIGNTVTEKEAKSAVSEGKTCTWCA